MVKTATLHLNAIPRPVVREVHVCPPIVVHTDLSSFRTTVQELTGFKREPDIRAHNGDQDTRNHSVMSIIKFNDDTFNDIDEPTAADNPPHNVNTSYQNKGIDENHGYLREEDTILLPPSTSSASSINPFMIPQPKEPIWGSDEDYQVFSYLINSQAYTPELPPVKNINLQVMDMLSMEVEEHENSDYLQAYWSSFP